MTPSSRFDGGRLDSYSASGHYQGIVRQFPTPFTGSVVSSHRRKDGETRVLISPGAQNFQIPEHLVGQVQPQLDLALLHALEAAHAGLDAKGWGPYEASITRFLMANGESPDVPIDAESIATYAALERLVDAEHKKPGFLLRFGKCLTSHSASSACFQNAWIRRGRRCIDFKRRLPIRFGPQLSRKKPASA